MAIRSFRPSSIVSTVVAAVVSVSASAGAPSGSAAASTPALLPELACAVTSLTGPLRLSAALGTGLSATVVRLVNDLTPDELARLSEDDTTWVDTCGRVFVVDHAVPEHQQAAVSSVAADEVPSDVFALSSRPTSTRTVYLDFDGATYSGTRWKNGEQIVSAAYSIDADPSTFSEIERAQIFRAWRVVAEDLAPFDVNVTTRRPDVSSLTRSSSADQTYGIPVVVTPTNSVGADCSCGGIAYVSTFGRVGAADYQPAWIFTSGSGTAGDNVGQVISHEVGHSLGLRHDGTSRTSYYAGDRGWAPIMGSSYGRRAAHWSGGEYADANNTEDDVALIAEVAPVLADDHPSASTGGTRVTAGTPVSGTITSRADVDSFTFTASAGTSVTVAGPSGVSNLDVRLSIHDSRGVRIATVDPTADSASEASMDATWSAVLPASSATYTAVVDGVGNGSPAEAGRYSDYGSIGTYTVALVTGQTETPVAPPPTTEVPPVRTTPSTTGATSPVVSPSATPTVTSVRGRMGFTTTRLPRARVGRSYRAMIAFVGPVAEARVDRRLPLGLRWRVRDGRILITGKVARASVSTFATVLSGDGPSVRHRFRLVTR